MVRGLFYLLAPVLFIWLAGCAGGESDPQTALTASPTADVGPACTNDATATAIVGGNQTRFAAPAETRAAEWDYRSVEQIDDEIQCRLRRAALQLADLPSGWTTIRNFGRFDPVYDRSAQSVCGLPLPSVIAGVGNDYEVREAEAVELVSYRIVLLDVGQSEMLMSAIRRTCGLLAEDKEASYRRGIDEVKGLGDDALQVDEWLRDPDETETASEPELVAHNIVVRVGDLLSILTVATESGAIDPYELATTLTMRLSDVESIPEPTPRAGEGCMDEPTATDDEKDRALRALLLTVDDLEAGWVEDTPEPCTQLGNDFFCQSEGGIDYPDSETSVHTAFVRSSGIGRYGFSLVIAAYEGSNAKKALSVLSKRNVQGECEATVEGESFTWSYTPLPALGLGDEAQSWIAQTTGFPNREEVSLYLAWIRRGNEIAVLIYQPRTFRLLGDSGGRDETEESNFRELAGIVDAKFASVTD